MPAEQPVTRAWPFYRFVRSVCHGWILLMGGVTISGKENVPGSGPFLLAPNHRAIVDPPYLALVTDRPMYFMGKEELFRIPVFGAIIRNVGSFPVKRGSPDRAALRRAVDLLKAGEGVAIFPEGTRSQDTSLQEAEKGFALIARQTDAVIIPVAVEGTEKILPRGATRLHRAHVTVTIGKPLSVAEIMAAKPEGEKDVLAWIGAQTMDAIGAAMRSRGPAKKESPESARTPLTPHTCRVYNTPRCPGQSAGPRAEARGAEKDAKKLFRNS